MYTLIFKTTHILVLWSPALFNEEWTLMYTCCARNQAGFWIVPDKEFLWAPIRSLKYSTLYISSDTKLLENDMLMRLSNRTKAEVQNDGEQRGNGCYGNLSWPVKCLCTQYVSWKDFQQKQQFTQTTATNYCSRSEETIAYEQVASFYNMFQGLFNFCKFLLI